MRMVAAKFPWEVPQPSHVLVASALARGRPIALATGPRRLDGMPDSEVAKRYTALAAAFGGQPDPGGGPSLQELEGEPAEQTYPAWETLVMRTGAADDPVTIELAREVWEALGANEYALCLRGRPRTFRGFLEGRAWIAGGVLSTLAVVIAALAVQIGWGVPWWLWLPVIVAAPIVVFLLFRRRYGKGQRRGGRALPHF